MEAPLMKLLPLFEDARVPAWGPDEEEIDAPTWPITPNEEPSAYPGAGLTRHPMLYIGEGCNRMYLVNHGRVVWTYCAGKGWEYDDVWMMTNGHILFSRMYWAAEITPFKETVWRFNAPEGTEIHTVQPLGLDRVLLMMNAKPSPRAMIVNKRTGAVEMDAPVPYDPSFGVHGQFRRFRMTAAGTFLLPCLCMNRVVEYDRQFREVWHYDIPKPWAAVRLANGNTLITDEADGLHREVDRRGQTVWEIALSELPERFRPAGTQSCVRLDNGNTILTGYGDEGKHPQLVEVTPDKQVVWALKDWQTLGPATAVQILSEHGIPEQPGACAR